MAKLPTLAVVIPAFNAEAFLARAVDSVFATDYPGIEVVIVEDGSTDATRVVAERLCREHPEQCRVLQHGDRRNHGVSSSRNLGIAASQSEWVALLDADDFYLPIRFAAFRRLLDSGQAFDAVYESCEIRGDGKDGAKSPNGNAESGGSFGIEESLTGPALLAALLMGRCWATSAITIRRNLLERAGFFDSGKRIAEDCDLWFRIAAVGRVVAGNLESPVSVYWRHENNTYHYELAHRIAMVEAMLDAWQWSERQNVAMESKNAFRTAVPTYALRSIISARSASEPGVAWRLLLAMARRGHLRFLTRLDTLRQILGLVRSRRIGTRKSMKARARHS